MRPFMGLDPRAVNNSPDADFLKQTGAFMESPLIPEKDFALIAAYYNSTAPEQMASPVEKEEKEATSLKLGSINKNRKINIDLLILK